MMSTIQLGKLYSYKRIYNNVYIVRFDNGNIIRVRDICFHEGDIFNKNDKEKALFKTIFNKETEKLTCQGFEVNLGTENSANVIELSVYRALSCSVVF